MFLCLRVDLDYVPWDAEEFGHGEPAMVLRLLDFARATGVKLHFFVSARSLRAFPTSADAVLGEGHDLDWLCTIPDDPCAFEKASELFRLAGHQPRGFALQANPLPDAAREWAKTFDFMSARGELCLDEMVCHPTISPTDVEAVRSGMTSTSWSKEVSKMLQLAAHVTAEATTCLSGQGLAKLDPSLQGLRRVLEAAKENGLPVRTLRDVAEGR